MTAPTTANPKSGGQEGAPRRPGAPVYGAFCVALLVLYLGIELRGWGFQPGGRSTIPMSVRQSPGGYRSYHFWHSGLHGGK